MSPVGRANAIILAVEGSITLVDGSKGVMLIFSNLASFLPNISHLNVKQELMREFYGAEDQLAFIRVSLLQLELEFCPVLRGFVRPMSRLCGLITDFLLFFGAKVKQS